VTRAGVWTLLSLVLQILLDSTHLSVALMWVARSSAPASALGAAARAISLVSPDEIPLLRDIEKLLARTLATAILPAYALSGAPLRAVVA
jgi:hypothetical protein